MKKQECSKHKGKMLFSHRVDKTIRLHILNISKGVMVLLNIVSLILKPLRRSFFIHINKKSL